MGNFKMSVPEWSITKDIAEEIFEYVNSDSVKLTQQEWVNVCMSIDDKIESFIHETIVNAIESEITRRTK